MRARSRSNLGRSESCKRFILPCSVLRTENYARTTPMSTELDLPSREYAKDDTPEAAGSPSYKVLGIRVDAVQIPDVIAKVEGWIAERGPSRFIAVTGMHGISESRHNANFRHVLQSADLVVPDGMPLVWLGRWHGFGLKRRVYGPELTETFCSVTGNKYRHFFYGGAPGVADSLAQPLHHRHGIRVVGTYCPPFRPLTEAEDSDLVKLIEAANADIVWVGLSTP